MYIKETLYQYKDDPKKFWRVLNSNLSKGDMISSDVTFNTGNDVYTNVLDSSEYIILQMLERDYILSSIMVYY